MTNVLKEARSANLPTVIVQYRTQGNNAVSAHHTHQYAGETIDETVARALKSAAAEEHRDVVLAGVQRIDARPARVRSEREMTVDMIAELSQALIAVNHERWQHEAGNSAEKPLYTTCLSITAAIKQLSDKL